MKVALQTWGSDGDIRPMIALAGGLVRRGHQATLSIGSVDNKDYRAMCGALGVDFVLAPEKSVTDVKLWLQQMGTTRNPFRMLRFMHEAALFPSHEAMSHAAESITADADLAVGHLLAVPLRIAAQKRSLPYATISFWPGLFADRTRPPDGLPNLANWLNVLLWRWGFALIDRAVGEGYRKLFEKHGMTWEGGVMKSCASTELDLIACSSVLWPDIIGYGAHRFCGAFALPGEAEPEPLPLEIEKFLAASDPPVFITLGSMGQLDSAATEQLLAEVAEHSGERAIVQRDLRNPPPRPVSDRLIYIGRTSHAALVPRCSAVLHHGGAGTTHTVLAAGRPAVVCGFMEEQHSWGRALKRRGVGRGAFLYGRVSAKKLGALLGAAARDPKMRAQAAELGAKVAAEDPVGDACRQLEALAASRARPAQLAKTAI